MVLLVWQNYGILLEEIFEKNKVENATKIESSVENREMKDTSLYSTWWIFWDSKFLFYLNEKPLDLNSQWFINNQYQSVFKIKLWNKSVIIKLQKEE